MHFRAVVVPQCERSCSTSRRNLYLGQRCYCGRLRWKLRRSWSGCSCRFRPNRTGTRMTPRAISSGSGKIWAAVLVAIGIPSVMAGLLPIAEPDAALGWASLLPLGACCLAAAARVLASLRTSTLVDQTARQAVFRLAVGTAFAGLLSSWLALAVYKELVIQVGGLAAGGALLFCSTVLFGGWYDATR